MPDGERIGDLMVARGLLNRAAAEAVATEQVCSKTRFASIAVRSGQAAEQDTLEVLASQRGVPVVDLAGVVVPAEVIRLVPREVAQRAVILAVACEESKLLLAMADPHVTSVIREVEFATGFSVLPHGALHFRLMELIPRAYAAKGDYFFAPKAAGQLQDVRGHVPVLGAKSSASDDFEIEVEDEPLTLFDVDDVQEVVPSQEAPEKQQPAAQGKTILVVEDEPDIQRLVVNALKPFGHQVFTADRGLKALELIKATRPDLIILDAMLPEVHGFEICRKVKQSKRFGSTPVLMISAIYRGWRIAEDIKTTYGVDDFLEKPFRIDDLKRRVSQLLERTVARGDEEALSAEIASRLSLVQNALKQENFESAFTELRRLEILEPFSPRIQYFLGQVLEHRGKAFQAIYHFERAIELRPNYFAAATSLAMLYERGGFRNKAVEMWERALQAAPQAEVRAQIKGHLVEML